MKKGLLLKRDNDSHSHARARSPQNSVGGANRHIVAEVERIVGLLEKGFLRLNAIRDRNQHEPAEVDGELKLQEWSVVIGGINTTLVL